MTKMKEKLTQILLGIVLVLLAIDLMHPPLREWNPYPLFTDERGHVIDPYLEREVKNSITAHAGEIQQCYNRLVEKSKNSSGLLTEGTVHLDWIVKSNGAADQVRMIYSQITDTDFKKCLLETIGGWQFPTPGHERYAEHTFRFSRQTEPSPAVLQN